VATKQRSITLVVRSFFQKSGIAPALTKLATAMAALMQRSRIWAYAKNIGAATGSTRRLAYNDDAFYEEGRARKSLERGCGSAFSASTPLRCAAGPRGVGSGLC
jgi:hypothetical protein